MLPITQKPNISPKDTSYGQETMQLFLPEKVIFYKQNNVFKKFSYNYYFNFLLVNKIKWNKQYFKVKNHNYVQT